MDSFHLLVDSTPNVQFPNNHASQFSIPLSMDATKGWEVAVKEFVHPDKVVLSQKKPLLQGFSNNSQTKVYASNKPIKVYLSNTTTLSELLSYIETNFKSLIKLTLTNTHCTWKVIDSNYFIILSDGLRHATELWQNVLTPWDKSAKSCLPINFKQSLPANQYLIFIPLSYTHETHTIRSAQQAYSCNKLIKTLDKHMDAFYDRDTLRLLPQDDSHLFIMSKGLHTLLPFNQAGMYRTPLRRRWDGMCHFDLKEGWTLDIYKLADMDTYHPTFSNKSDYVATLKKSLTLPISQADKTAFISKLKVFSPPTSISLHYDNHVIIDVKSMDRKYVMEAELHQPLGFNESVFVGPKIYISERPLSLGFHHLFVYCNILDYTMVGEGEQRLLFSTAVNDNTPILPTYVSMAREHTKQMEITICNEKGELINFPSNSTTRLKLHFKPQ